MTEPRMSGKYVMCMDPKRYPLDLTLHKVYKVLPDEKAARRKMIRIVDDSGEDYLYATSRFVPVQIPHGISHE